MALKTFEFATPPPAASVTVHQFRQLELSLASDAPHAIPPSDANAPSRLSGASATRRPRGDEQALFSNRAAVKVLTSQVAMHLTELQRTDLFKQVDELLNADAWTEADQHIRVTSFRSFLRFLIYYSNVRRPALTVTGDGDIAASWFAEGQRLTVEFLDDDKIRLVMARRLDEDQGTETAAYQGPVHRIGTIVAAFNGTKWYQNDTT